MFCLKACFCVWNLLENYLLWYVFKALLFFPQDKLHYVLPITMPRHFKENWIKSCKSRLLATRWHRVGTVWLPYRECIGLITKDWSVPRHRVMSAFVVAVIVASPSPPQHKQSCEFFSDTVFVHSFNYLVILWIINSICHGKMMTVLTHWPNWLWGTRWCLLPGGRWIGEMWLLESTIWLEQLLRSLVLAGFSALWMPSESRQFPVLCHYTIVSWENYFFYYLIAI